ncbi:uncharacterized protein LOC125077975 [Vanessa atalanta]|uniref:uncharacterized protein LOC125077975 n=1 Tax=Vanessa atalanta TaxID=42275 RepID=UPI001FCDBF46|nr:uncharacterized protein LOC125077975 [Vanessa atalanta]
MTPKYLMYYLFIGLLKNVKCQIPVFPIALENELVAQNGLGWPSAIQVAKGNEVLMKLRVSLENQNTCTVTDPKGLKFDISSPPSSKYQKWNDGCSIRVRNITFEDEGRWRLTASEGSKSITGWIEVTVLEKTSTYTAPPISLQDGETQTKVDLSSLDNAYCVVAKPFSESSLIPGKCSVTLDRTTRAVQGNWQIYLGLPGTVSEVQAKRHVTVQTEHLDVGYVRDASNRLHLYCNILHTTKNITFCRFQKTSNPYGYNVIDGLSDGSHSYYGKGFDLKQCGMTIEKPTSEDYGTWRCSVGVQMFVGTQIQQQTPMQALISVTHTSTSTFIRKGTNEDRPRTIFVQEDSSFTITCNSATSLSYCWFQHPNGTQYTPVKLVSEEQLFWYTGESLVVGHCGITFAHASIEDDGKWLCSMGPRSSLGVEMTDTVQVRVTGPLAANQKNVPVRIGGNATLYCHTANGRRPLKYCRFLSPKFVGMNIDSSVTPENAILNRYYFTPERELNFGDCSLSILSVEEDDIGSWTCAAVVDNEILESRDTILVSIDDQRRNYQFQASIIGMSVGLSVLVIVLIGIIAYKRTWVQYFYCTRKPTVSDEFSLQRRIATSSSIQSGSSNE